MAGTTTSEGKCLQFGLSQGPILGLHKYGLFSEPISKTCQRHNRTYHFHVDLTQVYAGIMPKET